MVEPGALVARARWDGVSVLRHGCGIIMKFENKEERDEWLKSISPKREDYDTEEAYLEAKSGFTHRFGPLLRNTPSIRQKDSSN